MIVIDVFAIAMLLASGVFFLGGTLGLLRFPDTYSRLHALTKADNLGLGFLVLALIPYAGSIAIALKMVAVWLLVMLLSSGATYLVARHSVAIEAERERNG